MNFFDNFIKYVYVDPFSKNNWKLRLVSVFLMILWMVSYFFMSLSTVFYLLFSGWVFGSFGLMAKVFDKKKHIKKVDDDFWLIKFCNRLFQSFYFLFSLIVLFEVIRILIDIYEGSQYR